MMLKFSTRLYSKRAVLDAVKRYRRFGTLKVRQTPAACYVDITRTRPGLEARLPGEIGNYILVATREERL